MKSILNTLKSGGTWTTISVALLWLHDTIFPKASGLVDIASAIQTHASGGGVAAACGGIAAAVGVLLHHIDANKTSKNLRD